jgi:hypothetical protein
VCAAIKNSGEGLPGAATPAPPRPQNADEKAGEEHHDADEQQKEQALDDDAHDAQDNRHDHQEQDKGKHSILRSVGCSAAGRAPLAVFPALC